jgi:hypothetical protein
LRTSELVGAAFVALVMFFMGACVLPFDDYPVGDVCEAGPDPEAPDPVLRGCDAGAEPVEEAQVNAAGASDEAAR